MTGAIDRVISYPAGRAVFQAVRPFVHLARRIANPGVSTDHMIARVAYRDRKFAIQHRRWSRDDVLAIKQSFEDYQYDLPRGAHGVLIENIYQEIVAAGKQPLIVDCGANIGTSVAWFSARYPKAHITAIEPAPSNFALLRHNTAGLDVDLHQAGIAAEDGRAYLRMTGGEMGYKTNTEQKGIEIDLVSLKTLMATKPESDYTPFILKIDIEGAEETLFSGDTTLFNRFPLIVIELHDWLFPGQLSSQGFFRFHAAAGREFCMNKENVASIIPHSSLLKITGGFEN